MTTNQMFSHNQHQKYHNNKLSLDNNKIDNNSKNCDNNNKTMAAVSPSDLKFTKLFSTGANNFLRRMNNSFVSHTNVVRFECANGAPKGVSIFNQ